MGSKPEKIRQKYIASCWAACMESLSKKSFRLETHFQDWYVSQWGPGPPTGGLDYNSQDFETFRQEFGFSKSIVPAKKLTEDQVLGWLRGGDYFILIEQQENGSHARLAYDWIEGGIQVMDPDPATGGYKRLFPVDLNQVVVLYW